MIVRELERADAGTARDIVQRSMNASYSLGPSTIEAAIDQWFGADAIDSVLAVDDRAMLVAERSGAVVGVVDVVYVAETNSGDVLWLHVDPDFRGEGIGQSLFQAAREWLTDAGADSVRGTVLSNNTDGNAFYDSMGFDRVGEREVEIDGTLYTERIYHEEARDRMRVLEDDGHEVYVDQTDADRGSLGLFYTAYSDADREHRYGYHCGHCETLQTAMDSMGRIECSECGNTRKPTRWDAAYL